MGIFARIDGSKVAETITLPSGAAISDYFHSGLTWVDVTSVTPSPQPGWTATSTGSSWTFSAPPAPPGPTLAQQAALALTTGLLISSGSIPTLNGTYAVDPIAQGRIASVSTYILVNSRFPGGVMSYPWIDLANQPHVFPDTTAFQSFATAIADYVAALDLIIVTGTGTLPAATATIA
jgi:hypothetical protein